MSPVGSNPASLDGISEEEKAIADEMLLNYDGDILNGEIYQLIMKNFYPKYF